MPTKTEEVRDAIVASGYDAGKTDAAGKNILDQMKFAGGPDQWGQLAWSFGRAQGRDNEYWTDAVWTDFVSALLPTARSNIQADVDVAKIDKPSVDYSHQLKQQPQPGPKAKAKGRVPRGETAWSADAEQVIRELSKKKKEDMTADDFQMVLKETKKCKGIGVEKVGEKKPKLSFRLSAYIMKHLETASAEVIGDFESEGKTYQAGTDEWSQELESLLVTRSSEVLFPRLAAEAVAFMTGELRNSVREQDEQRAKDAYWTSKLATKPADTKVLMCKAKTMCEQVFKRLEKMAQRWTDGGLVAAVHIRELGADMKIEDCDLEIKVGQAFLQFKDTSAAGVFKGIASVSDEFDELEVASVPALPVISEDDRLSVISFDSEDERF